MVFLLNVPFIYNKHFPIMCTKCNDHAQDKMLF